MHSETTSNNASLKAFGAVPSFVAVFFSPDGTTCWNTQIHVLSSFEDHPKTSTEPIKPGKQQLTFTYLDLHAWLEMVGIVVPILIPDYFPWASQKKHDPSPRPKLSETEPNGSRPVDLRTNRS